MRACEGDEGKGEDGLGKVGRFEEEDEGCAPELDVFSKEDVNLEGSKGKQPTTTRRRRKGVRAHPPDRGDDPSPLSWASKNETDWLLVSFDV